MGVPASGTVRNSRYNANERRDSPIQYTGTTTLPAGPAAGVVLAVVTWVGGVTVVVMTGVVVVVVTGVEVDPGGVGKVDAVGMEDAVPEAAPGAVAAPPQADIDAATASVITPRVSDRHVGLSAGPIRSS